MENEKLLKELADAKVKIAELESFKRRNLIAEIKKFGNKYSEDELIEKGSDILEEILDAVRRFGDSSSATVLPIAARPEIEEKVDFTTVFEDVNKEFNMKNIKISRK